MQTMERVARKANVVDKVHETRRRYALNGTSQAKESSRTRESTKEDSWNYKVIRGKWSIPEKEREKRKAVAVRKCNMRALRNMANGKTRGRYKEKEPEVEEAIKELEQLQITELQEPAVTTKGRKRKDQQKGIEEPKNKRIELEGLWLEFTLAERIRNGWYERMPDKNHGRCACGRASISYPHWPPSSKEEALQQFEYSINNENEHRKNLVIRWWEHFNDFANMSPWNVSERQGRYREAAELIKEHSLLVQKELERSYAHKERPKGWRCHEYCDRVIERKEVSCLCHCGQHRDECPIHS
jgi:hypothetical protein